MKVWLTQNDLAMVIYGLENTRYAYGKSKGHVDNLIENLHRIKE